MTRGDCCAILAAMTLAEIRTPLSSGTAYADVLNTAMSDGCECVNCVRVRAALATYVEDRAHAIVVALVAEQTFATLRREYALRQLQSGPDDLPGFQPPHK